MTMSSALFRYLTLPATVAHELTHAVTGLPWATRIAIEWRRSGTAVAHIDWRDNAPWWAIGMTALAPFAAGSLAATLALIQWINGGMPTPSTPLGWSQWTIVAMWWVVFVAPSGDDLRASGVRGRSE